VWVVAVALVVFLVVSQVNWLSDMGFDGELLEVS